MRSSMSKQTRVGFVFSLIVMFGIPGDAMAGGLGIFKRCRAKQPACCPRPSCDPCQPVGCESCISAPVATSDCDSCGSTSAPPSEPKTIGWYVVGTGMNSTQTTICTSNGPCRTNPGDAYRDYTPGTGCYIYSYVLMYGECPGTIVAAPSIHAEDSSAQEAALLTPPDKWDSFVTYLKKDDGTPKTKTFRNYDTAEEALQRAIDFMNSNREPVMFGIVGNPE